MCACSLGWAALLANRRRRRHSVLDALTTGSAPNDISCRVAQYGCVGSSLGNTGFRIKASRGFEPRSLNSETRVLTVTPRGPLRLASGITVSLLGWGGCILAAQGRGQKAQISTSLNGSLEGREPLKARQCFLCSPLQAVNCIRKEEH